MFFLFPENSFSIFLISFSNLFRRKPFLHRHKVFPHMVGSYPAHHYSNAIRSKTVSPCSICRSKSLLLENSGPFLAPRFPRTATDCFYLCTKRYCCRRRLNPSNFELAKEQLRLKGLKKNDRERSCLIKLC